MRLFLLLLSLAILSSSCELQLKSEGVEVVMNTCHSVGTFSIGFLEDETWKRMTYHYPRAWRGTYLCLKVDEVSYCNSQIPSNVSGAKLMDHFSPKARAARDAVVAEWLLPELRVEQRLEVRGREVKHTVVVKNLDNESRPVGLMLLIDTMLGGDDGAPIYVPGEGLKETEASYAGEKLNFKLWKAFGVEEKLVATGILWGEGLTYPDRVVVANWKRAVGTSWAYEANPSVPITYDSALLLYWHPLPLGAGEERSYSTLYMAGEPPLPIGIAVGFGEVVLDRIDSTYCPGELIKLRADLLSREVARASVRLVVLDEAGETVFSSTKVAEQFKGYASLDFGFRLEREGSYTVLLQLLEGERVLEEKGVRLRVAMAERCQGPLHFPLAVLGILLAVVLVGMYLALRAENKVMVVRDVQGRRVRVVVENRCRDPILNCVLREKVPLGTELKVHTSGASVRGDELVLEAEKLPPEQQLVLEYELLEGEPLGEKAEFSYELRGRACLLRS